ncbi:DUF3871 family protein [Algibacter sp. L4_22]|uniref:DUF3871 family protein n=1 Tax=Algibacter sp. L4_22 TaxID=2942477 RepID=UPI00201B6BCC|nr:DUF3871 family protein [Algibacter sp. L4_22]MCL5127125.1 DUF3871 family protein [Algibacter sp. L4_22]
MELITVNNSSNQIIEPHSIVETVNRNFIEANTKAVTLQHLKEDCTIPVYAKDNESTISHFEFIDKTIEIVNQLFPEVQAKQPAIRVSHIIKGRIPSAIGKPAKELLEHEKTLYYERCAFVIEIPSVNKKVNGNELSLSIGGVRAYNQENLYSRKNLEKFKLFIGFQNKVCTNMCISTDGFSNEIRIASIEALTNKAGELFSAYNMQKQLDVMESMANFSLNEEQFAHFIGKIKMYQHLNKNEQKWLFPIGISDSQLSHVVKDYYRCPNFGKNEDGSINLWNLYNLFTEANKSSYIDSNLERNVKAYELINNLTNSIKNQESNYLLPSI